MAEALLNDGSTSLAAANWSDATGFADNADLTIGGGTQTITGGLDNSGLTEGINRLTVSASFGGIIGSAAAPLQVDVDGGTSPSNPPTLRYLAGAGALHYQPDGDNNLCQRLVHGGAGALYLYGTGTVTDYSQSAGVLSALAATVVTTARLYGGQGTIAYASTGFTSCVITGGSWLIRRGGTFDIRGGNVVIDLSDGGTLTSLTISGTAVVSVLRADTIATLYVYSGTLDLRRLKKRSTIAGTAGIIGPKATFLYSPDTVTDSGLVFIEDEGGRPTLGG